MKLRTTLMASCALALIGTTAIADCAADLAQLQAGEASADHSEGISKDGSLAPLETPDDAAGGDSAAASVDDTATTGGSPAATDMAAADGTAETSGSTATNATSTPSDTADAGGSAASDDTVTSSAGTSSAGGGDGIAKDGSLAPLEGTEAEANTAHAMSGQDAQAQQDGDPTAAESAADSPESADAADTISSEPMASEAAENAASDSVDATGSGASDEGPTTESLDRDDLIAEAQAALDAGDEAACRDAVEKIEAL